MPPRARRRAHSVLSSTGPNESASVVDEAPATRRSKRRKIEPAEVQVKSEQQELKLKTKTKKKLPRGKKVKEEVVEDDNTLEGLGSATAQSTGSPLEVVHVTDDLSKELEALRKQLRKKDEQLQTQKEVLNTLHQQFNCQICFDTLLRPYSLVPCGHIACLSCLQQWFRTNVVEEDGRDSPTPIIRRKKTCPNCRTKVVQRPVAAFLIKEALSTLDILASGDSATRREPVLAAGEDPWEGIFLSEQDGAGRGVDGAFIDHDDGGVRRCQHCLFEIYHGRCLQCGEEYEMSDNDSNDSDESMLLRERIAWGGMGVEISDDEDQDQYESDFINDEEDDHRHRQYHDQDDDYGQDRGNLIDWRDFEHPEVIGRIEINDDDTDDEDEDDAHWVPQDRRRGWRGRGALIHASDDEEEAMDMRVDTDEDSEVVFEGVNLPLERGEHYDQHIDDPIFLTDGSDDDADVHVAQPYHHHNHYSTDEDGEDYDSDGY